MAMGVRLARPLGFAPVKLAWVPRFYHFRHDHVVANCCRDLILASKLYNAKVTVRLYGRPWS